MQRAAAAAAPPFASSSRFALAARRFATEVDPSVVKMVVDLHKMHVDTQKDIRAEGRLFREEVKGLLKELNDNHKADHKALRVELNALDKSLSEKVGTLSEKVETLSKDQLRLDLFMRWTWGLVAVGGTILAAWYRIWPQ